MKSSLFGYSLPKELIAQKALEKRECSKLMAVKEKVEHRKFFDILDYLEKGDVLVINDTKVVKAKLSGKKSTGSPAEVIIEKVGKPFCRCRLKCKHPRQGTIIEFSAGLKAEVAGTDGDIFLLKFNKNPENALKKLGELPQPTYIKRKVSENEYQTVYAKKCGSVAAPTAGLHFTKELIEKAKKKGVKIAKVCLHIGFGTFLPVNSEHIEQHRIHSEFFEIGKDAAEKINSAKRVIAVGTTSLRALESADYDRKRILPSSGWTDVFIKPGYKFRSRTSAMITNFHLPKSTLILMVSAFAGRKNVLDAYKEAIKKKYRFYSLGDAMLLFRENSQPQ